MHYDGWYEEVDAFERFGFLPKADKENWRGVI